MHRGIWDVCRSFDNPAGGEKQKVAHVYGFYTLIGCETHGHTRGSHARSRSFRMRFFVNADHLLTILHSTFFCMQGALQIHMKSNLGSVKLICPQLFFCLSDLYIYITLIIMTEQEQIYDICQLITCVIYICSCSNSHD